jgi:hypothetical protein
MERVIMPGSYRALFRSWKEKPTQRLKVSRATAWVQEVPKADFAELAKHYRRFTCQRSSRGLATKATGISERGVIGEDLHRYMQTLARVRHGVKRRQTERSVAFREWCPGRLTNDLYSFRLVVDAFLHRQHGLSPLQQFLLLYGLSVCVRVL